MCDKFSKKSRIWNMPVSVKETWTMESAGVTVRLGLEARREIGFVVTIN